MAVLVAPGCNSATIERISSNTSSGACSETSVRRYVNGVGREFGVAQEELKSLFDHVGGKGTGPAGVGRHEDQRAGNFGVPPVKLERKPPAP